VAVTAGYMHAEARREFYAKIDAANVDLKAFTDEFYFRLTGSRLQPVLDTLVYLRHETPVWLEITTLLIPGRNDSDGELRAMSQWLYRELGADVPLHLSAFHPDYKLDDLPPTPPATLRRARRIALDEGLHFVYTGNVHDPDGDTTYCPGCRAPVIVRDWYAIESYQLTDEGRCAQCATPIPGRFGRFGKPFGRRRIPVTIGAYAR
jgi:pyruvate formate lyase activating enzyme